MYRGKVLIESSIINSLRYGEKLAKYGFCSFYTSSFDASMEHLKGSFEQKRGSLTDGPFNVVIISPYGEGYCVSDYDSSVKKMSDYFMSLKNNIIPPKIISFQMENNNYPESVLSNINRSFIFDTIYLDDVLSDRDLTKIDFAVDVYNRHVAVFDDFLKSDSKPKELGNYWLGMVQSTARDSLR